VTASPGPLHDFGSRGGVALGPWSAVILFAVTSTPAPTRSGRVTVARVMPHATKARSWSRGAAPGAAALALLVLAAPAQAGELFRDDFSRYPPGWLSEPVGQLNGAIQEYHYLPHRGVPTHPWSNPIVHLDSWVAGDEDGRTYLEQHLITNTPDFMAPLFVVGDPKWTSTTVEARVQPLSLAGMAGVVFRYQTSRHHYRFALTDGQRVRLALRFPLEKSFREADWRELGSAPFPYDPRRSYLLRVENHGPKIRAYVDGKLLIEASDSTLLEGKAGITASRPARFWDFRVSASDAAQKRIRAAIERRERELALLRARNPRPVLWKKFRTPGFGAGRNVRFGDLDGDGRLDMLIAQNIRRVRDDAFDHISSLTAVNLDGEVLWQIGRPGPRNGLLTNDTPFQIHDIDGDGRNEVLVVKDFKLQVLDGATGRLKHWVWMPEAPKENRDRPYEINNGDSIAFFRLSDKAGRREMLIKDRYRSFWIFDDRLKVLWRGQGQTGHYPFPFDFDGDGRDEIAIGYSVWNAEGRVLWSRDAELRDHTDALSVGNFSGDPRAEPRVYACASDEGFAMFSRDGRILKHARIGHGQTQSVGKFLPDRPGLQIMVANFWKNPGIVTLFDHDAQILRQAELIPGSSHLAPVNWRGDGQELALLSGSVKDGGLIDGHFRRVVLFPDDGHPDLASAVLDVTGDGRDEIVLWNQEEVWIYTQDRPFEGKQIYSPRRNPLYNDSNYRSFVSLPGWSDRSRK
jgi:rhamnogalacturonan endolyase